MTKRTKGGPKKPVFCLETAVVYRSLTDAALDLGLTRQAIGQVCRGVQKFTKNYTFRYATPSDIVTFHMMESVDDTKNEVDQKDT